MEEKWLLLLPCVWAQWSPLQVPSLAESCMFYALSPYRPPAVRRSGCICRISTFCSGCTLWSQHLGNISNVLSHYMTTMTWSLHTPKVRASRVRSLVRWKVWHQGLRLMVAEQFSIHKLFLCAEERLCSPLFTWRAKNQQNLQFQLKVSWFALRIKNSLL